MNYPKPKDSMTQEIPTLLLAHRFPPYSRVGAYRWSRLSGRLARMGHRLGVLTVNWPQMDQHYWLKEVEHDNLLIKRIPSGYPQVLQYRRFPKKIDTTIGKVIRGLVRLIPHYDEAVYWRRHLIPAALDFIDRHNAKVVIATGGPYSVNYWAALIKQQRPHIRLIQDFRDPWFTEKHETDPWFARYQQSLASADDIVAVTPEMLALYQEHCPKTASDTNAPRFHCIENGVDADFLNKARNAAREKEVDIIYTGALFKGRVAAALRLIGWLNQRTKIGKPVSIKFIGRVDSRIKEAASSLVQAGLASFLPALPQSAVFDEICGARWGLQITSPGNESAIYTTKLIEYPALGVPVLSLNDGGAADRFIKESQIGVSLNALASNLEIQLDAAIQTSLEPAFDGQAYDFNSIAQRYSQLLE